MHLVQILLPRTDNAGTPFANAEFQRVKDDLGSEFKGVTAYLQAPAEGLWRQGGQSLEDDIVIFEVMTGELDLLDWRMRRARLEQRFRQDKVIVRFMTIGIV
jgi:hypothetical protein